MIVGHLNINSIINKFNLPKEMFKKEIYFDDFGSKTWWPFPVSKFLIKVFVIYLDLIEIKPVQDPSILQKPYKINTIKKISNKESSGSIFHRNKNSKVVNGFCCLYSRNKLQTRHISKNCLMELTPFAISMKIFY